LHASWQDCSTVWQREVDSWENPRESNEEEGVINIVYFLLKVFPFLYFSFSHNVIVSLDQGRT
jgi:hypothetical protein